ncbi:cryptochrome/photolyase family protein [Pseudovibrio exalbescens]|uniref:cryptochrome/photolyase family protein n=1 Tax=Pseudovibrio exalbescens TaxID=197461 RepID=UPI0023663F97|nr:cryptochrome/photolyase family protein [Pseudovibrio exalbescens]MDD7911046.1 cryptochrome/photolyase family protein [Pseudovibrio exalbescens]
MASTNLVVVLGDQLSMSLSSLRDVERADTVVLMAEVAAEASYVKHHKKKIAFLFSAMRHHAQALEADGWRVDYVKYGASGNSGTLCSEIVRAAKRWNVDRVFMTEPGEWRLKQEFEALKPDLACPLEMLPDDRFLCSHAEFGQWSKGRKQLRMEYFYRDMRRKTGLLMNGDQPEGGQWNYDQENRKPAADDLFMPNPPQFEPDSITKEVLTLCEKEFADHVGELFPFWLGTTREQAEQAADYFFEQALPFYGDYQDAMLVGQPFLYHSVLSPYINCGLLDPLELCRRAEEAYKKGRAPLNAVEGFIRQIIGWREFIRGIYWLKMPEYIELNALNAHRDLPAFYWTADTQMLCLKEAIGQTLQHAYAHHIQRLMLPGNFAMLVGVAPKQIHEWYLAVYADAYEWVELPNTLGMSQFADGGIFASKPYAASGNYVAKMSNYCDSCTYNVKKKTGQDACPMNALYWHFLSRNEKQLAKNPRIAQIYSTWNRMSDAKRKEYIDSADAFLQTLT